MAVIYIFYFSFQISALKNLFLCSIYSFTMCNLYTQLYHRYVCLGKIIVYIECVTICGFRHPVGVMECILVVKGGLLLFQRQREYWKENKMHLAFYNFADWNVMKYWEFLKSSFFWYNETGKLKVRNISFIKMSWGRHRCII